MRQKQAFDTHSDLLVQRYQHGIRLVQPNPHTESIPKNSLANLYRLSLPVFFMGHHDVVVDGNDASADLVGAPSTRDLPGRTLHDFYDQESEILLSTHNSDIMRNKTMQILEEAGSRKDEIPFHYLAFKFPVYDTENKIMGLMGYCIRMETGTFTHIARAISELMSMGLLNTTQPLLNTHLTIEFSRREKDVLAHLIRGKTAKKIGDYLNLSPRTIESYIENIKVKANCKSKAELIDKFIDEFYT